MSNCPIFPCPWRRTPSAHWGHVPCRELIPFPRTYFEVEDIRPGEDELSWITDKIFVSTAGGVSVPKELNRKILQYLSGKDLLRFSMVSKTAEKIVKHSHALMYDAIHEQIEDLLAELKFGWGWRQKQVNEHKFKVGNCVRVFGVRNGYIVRVTPKFVFFITEPDIFRSHPYVHRIGNDDGVKPMRPYYSGGIEIILNWRTWASVTEEFPYSD